jgi:hypothetical protein
MAHYGLRPVRPWALQRRGGILGGLPALQDPEGHPLREQARDPHQGSLAHGEGNALTPWARKRLEPAWLDTLTRIGGGSWKAETWYLSFDPIPPSAFTAID